MDNKRYGDLLRLRIDDPYTIIGVCMHLDSMGFDVHGLYMFGKLNISGILRKARLNKWIDITPLDKMVHVECGDTSVYWVKDNPNPLYNEIFFNSANELFAYLEKIN